MAETELNNELNNSPTEHLEKWLRAERVYGAAKFGVDQSDRLTSTMLSNNQNIGGQTAMYWNRMQLFEEGGAELQKAQAAAKMASATKSLWATLRSLERFSDEAANIDGLWIMSEHFTETDFYNIKPQLEKDDFWETSIGLGLTHLEVHIKRHGFAEKFRLSQLVRAEQIMLDSADVAALQFEQTLQATGNLPKPGISSGNIEIWLPE